MGELFPDLPTFDVPLPQDELRLLSNLPVWPTNQEVYDEDHAPARRLEKRRLIKISRQKMDPAGHWPTWFAGRISPENPND